MRSGIAYFLTGDHSFGCEDFEAFAWLLPEIVCSCCGFVRRRRRRHRSRHGQTTRRSKVKENCLRLRGILLHGSELLLNPGETILFGRILIVVGLLLSWLLIGDLLVVGILSLQRRFRRCRPFDANSVAMLVFQHVQLVPIVHLSSIVDADGRSIDRRSVRAHLFRIDSLVFNVNSD